MYIYTCTHTSIQKLGTEYTRQLETEEKEQRATDLLKLEKTVRAKEAGGCSYLSRECSGPQETQVRALARGPQVSWSRST